MFCTVKLVVYFFLVSLFSENDKTPSKVANRPSNILLILTDDQGWGDLAAHGNPALETPHLDHLKSQSASCTHFYVNPVCAPTRAALLTGRYAYRSGVIGVSRGWENMHTDEITIAELLQSSGYATGCFGKWHNGRHFDQHPLRQGFDQFFGFRGGVTHQYFDANLEYNDQLDVPTKGYIADVLTDSAISFMHTNRKQPFFCYLPLNTPHTPYQIGDDYFSKYQAKGFNAETASIYGMVENIDDNVGRIREFLADSKLDENTLIIFLSDNGPTGGNARRYNGEMKGNKGNLDEGGVRVPAFFYHKKIIPAGLQINMLTSHIDIFATMASFAKITPPKKLALDGIDLKPFLSGVEPGILQREIFTLRQINPHTKPRRDELQYSLRTPTHRLIKRKDNFALYDLLSDFEQKHNIADLQPNLVRDLTQKSAVYLDQIDLAVLRRPLCPIGQENAVRHELLADEAHLSGGLKFGKEHGYNGDWITSFGHPDDTITWILHAPDRKEYQVYIRYTCPPESISNVYRISSSEESLDFVIQKAFNTQLIPVPDRASSSGRSSEYKDFREVQVGNIFISAGKQVLEIRPIDIGGSTGIDLRAIILEPKG